MYGIEDASRNVEQTEGVRGFDSEGLSSLQNDYLDEALETKDLEMIVDRIDELGGDLYPPKAIDSNSLINEKLGDLKEDIDNIYLEAPNDFEQVQQISETMSEIEGARFEEWKNLSPQERLDAMQNIEILVADIAHRPYCEVKAESLDEHVYGYFDPLSNTITLNATYLDSSPESYKQTLDTIIHEGRHAYQHYNLDHRQVHPSDLDCANWHENIYGNVEEGGGYLSPSEVGIQRYSEQPVEADARAFAEDVLNNFKQ